MRVYGQLESAQLENTIPASISGTQLGRIYMDITTVTAGAVKYYDGAAWQTVAKAASSMVIYDSGSATAHGGTSSGDTKVRNFANARVSTGSDITYTAKTTTTADKFTAVTAGLYSIVYSDKRAGGTETLAITINSTVTSTSASTPITYAQGLRAATTTVSATVGHVSWTGRLAANDIIRFQTNGTADSTDSNCMVTITKIGD